MERDVEAVWCSVSCNAGALSEHNGEKQAETEN